MEGGQGAEQKCCGSGGSWSNLCPQTSHFSDSINSVLAPRPLALSPEQELAQNISDSTCILSIQAHRNTKQSDPHIQRLNQHPKLNRSGFGMACACNIPLVPGTAGAPAQRSPRLNQPGPSTRLRTPRMCCLLPQR